MSRIISCVAGVVLALAATVASPAEAVEPMTFTEHKVAATYLRADHDHPSYRVRVHSEADGFRRIRIIWIRVRNGQYAGDWHSSYPDMLAPGHTLRFTVPMKVGCKSTYGRRLGVEAEVLQSRRTNGVWGEWDPFTGLVQPYRFGC